MTRPNIVTNWLRLLKLPFLCTPRYLKLQLIYLPTITVRQTRRYWFRCFQTPFYYVAAKYSSFKHSSNPALCVDHILGVQGINSIEELI